MAQPPIGLPFISTKWVQVDVKGPSAVGRKINQARTHHHTYRVAVCLMEIFGSLGVSVVGARLRLKALKQG